VITVSWAWDWAAFNAEWVAALVAVALGIPAGLFINRQLESRMKRAERDRLREHQLAVLRAIKDEIDENQSLMDELEGELKQNQDAVPTYGLRTDLWHAVSRDVVGAISSEELIGDLSRLYFQYEHLQRKLNAQFEIGMRPAVTMAMAPLGKRVEHLIRDDIVGTVLAQIPNVRGLASHVLSLLEREISSLAAESGSKGKVLL
jgi:hypothetical protein